jgi:3-oxoacyl-(acyl-carrier-protein) synthase
MTRSRDRAVVTGTGCVSAFGVGVPALLDGLARGGRAVGPIRSFPSDAFPVQVAGEVPIPTITVDLLAAQPHLRALPGAAAAIERWVARGMLRERKVMFAALAAAEAWRDAGLADSPAAREASLAIGLGLPHAFLEDFAAVFDGRALSWSAPAAGALPPVRYRSPVDLAADTVAELLLLDGPIVTHTSACAAGALAVAHAASLVERGEAHTVLCGAADSMINPLGLGGMATLGATSPRAAPDACRPFDRRRDGIAIGEGAALFVVESEARARARGARVLCRVIGWGSSQDAYKPSAPQPDGTAAARAISRAIDRAGVAPSRVEYVNAHGTGTPLNDAAEVRALRLALGAHADRVPVSSIKGAVGHLMAASGAIELLSCLLPFTHGLLPPTANHELGDPECDLDVIGTTPRAGRPEIILSNSFGFGGQNAAVLLEAP